jgi:hypothetical protein
VGQAVSKFEALNSPEAFDKKLVEIPNKEWLSFG